MAEEVSADTDDLDAFVDRARRHHEAMASTHARLAAQRAGLETLPLMETIDGSAIAAYRELAAELDQTASLAAEVSAALQQKDWTDIVRTAVDGSWRIHSTMPNSPAFAWTLLTDPGALLPRYRSTALGVGDWIAGIAQSGEALSSLMPGSPRFAAQLRLAGSDPSQHPAMRFGHGLADAGDDLASLFPGTMAFADEFHEAVEARSMAEHDGLAAAGRLAVSTLDWETFERDPNRWFGRNAPDVVIDAATAGWGSRGSKVDDLATGIDDAARGLDDAARGLDDVARRVEVIESKPWRTFDRNLDEPFFEVLDDFHGDPNPPTKLRGGEGQLFLSDQHEGLALKRWHRSRLDEFDRSVEMLTDARAAVRSDPEVAAVLDVVEVHERGPDWILRDYDRGSEPLSRVLREGDPRAERAVADALQALEGTADPSLQTILERLDRPIPSANVHWSDETGRLLVIDMM